MSGPRPGVPWDFFLSASQISLCDFELKRLNDAVEIKKQVRKLLEEIYAAERDAAAARLMIETERLRSIRTDPIQESFDFPEVLSAETAVSQARRSQHVKTNFAA